MSNDDTFQSTGDEIGRIDLGNGYTIVVEDDGDADSCVNIRIEEPNGQRSGLYHGMQMYRGDKGDQALADALDDIGRGNHAARPSNDDSGPQTRQTAFSCADCNLTWPGSKNQNPGAGEDKCPNCADGDPS